MLAGSIHRRSGEYPFAASKAADRLGRLTKGTQMETRPPYGRHDGATPVGGDGKPRYWSSDTAKDRAFGRGEHSPKGGLSGWLNRLIGLPGDPHRLDGEEESELRA
jgi:hypothetical protein